MLTFCTKSATVHWVEWSHSTNDWIIGVPRATGYDTAGYKFLICGWSPALNNLKLNKQYLSILFAQLFNQFK